MKRIKLFALCLAFAGLALVRPAQIAEMLACADEGKAARIRLWTRPNGTIPWWVEDEDSMGIAAGLLAMLVGAAAACALTTGIIWWLKGGVS